VKTPGIFINATGAYLPDIVSVPDADENSMAGVAVAGQISSIEMGLEATREALARWGESVSRLALLFYTDIYHTGPDGWPPQSYLQRHAVGGHVLAAEVRQGCNGVFGALELAAAYLQALPEPRSAVIVSAANLDTPLLDRFTAMPGFLMGDGATCLIIGRTPGFARLRSVTSLTVPELEQLWRGGEPLHPAGAAVGRPLDLGARMEQFSVIGGGFTPSMARTLGAAYAQTVSRALDEAGIGVQDVTRVATTNEPRPKLEERLKSIGLRPESSTWSFSRNVGHSASDQLFAFDHLLNGGELSKGDYFLMIGIGPGMSFAAAVIEMIDEPPWTT